MAVIPHQKRNPKKYFRVGNQRVNLGPCQFCEHEPTRIYSGPNLDPCCDFCDELCAAANNLLRQPDFYVI